MVRKPKKPVESELTLKDLKAVVGGTVRLVPISLSPRNRHKLLHSHGFTNGIVF
jgi:hypothetical protein